MSLKNEHSISSCNAAEATQRLLQEVCGGKMPDATICRRLLEQGADPNVRGGPANTCLLARASYLGCLDVVNVLLEHGADPNERHEKKPPENMALHLAISWGRANIVHALLDGGADIDMQDGGGYTPLMSALISTSREKNGGLVNMLLDRGANTAVLGPARETALDIAVRWKMPPDIIQAIENAPLMQGIKTADRQGTPHRRKILKPSI
ncbi:MAG: ankyrin repeat domain-containing protein [Alphaproteobacteria bacterium]|nr:ankyrin repeat domain-containing protein [Alphaproteobacteria bacterium]